MIIPVFFTQSQYNIDNTHSYTDVSSGVYPLTDGHAQLIYGQHQYNSRSIILKTPDNRLMTLFAYNTNDSPSKQKMIVYDHTRAKASIVYDWGEQGEADIHLTANINALSDGTIITSVENTHNGSIRVRKSNNPYDLTSHTDISLFGNGAYPNFEVLNDDTIIMVVRSSFISLRVYKSTNGGDSFTLIGTLLNDTGGDGYWKYPKLIPRDSNNKFQLIVNERNVVGDHRYNHFVESSDGITWTNKAGTFSRDISVSPITTTEARSNCKVAGDGATNTLIYSATEYNGDVFLFGRWGSDARWYYYDSGWQYKNVSVNNPGDYRGDIIFTRAGEAYSLKNNNDGSNTRILAHKSSDNFDTNETVYLGAEGLDSIDVAVSKNWNKYEFALLTARASNSDAYLIPFNR